MSRSRRELDISIDCWTVLSPTQKEDFSLAWRTARYNRGLVGFGVVRKISLTLLSMLLHRLSLVVGKVAMPRDLSNHIQYKPHTVYHGES